MAKLDEAKVRELLAQVPGWSAKDDKLGKSYTLRDFLGAMRLVNEVAAIAEAEGHHPDFCVHYARVDFTIWTHAIGGLSDNDFILAAKIEEAAKRLATK